MATGKPILITGAAGFIGQTLAKRLHAAGRAVIGTDIARPARHSEADFPFVTADARDLNRHVQLAKNGLDGIIHCGGISGPMLLHDNPAEIADINLRGTLTMLELARSFEVPRFLYCSSVSAYGNQHDLTPITEETPLTASTVYGSTKAAGDMLVQTWRTRFDLSATCLRIGWVYGPGRRTDALLQPMIRPILGQAPAFALPSGGDHGLQFVHVDDVCAALIAALDATDVPRAAYNITGSAYLTVREIGGMLTSIADGPAMTLGGGLLEDTDLQGVVRIDRAAKDLSWSPQRHL